MKKFSCVLAFLAAFFAPRGAYGQQPIRVNCGGPAYTDSKGQLWSADYGFNSSFSTSTYNNNSSISNTSDPFLYQSERWGKKVSYTFTVPNGPYRLNLLESEIYWNSAGARLFNVVLNGATVDTNVDIFAQAGGKNIALTKSYTTTVSSGTITLELDEVLDNAKCSAIEIVSTAPTPTLRAKFAYDDGTAVQGSIALYQVSSSSETLVGTSQLDSNGLAASYLVLDPTGQYHAVLFDPNGIVITEARSIPVSQSVESQVIAALTKLEFDVVLFKATGKIKSVTSVPAS